MNGKDRDMEKLNSELERWKSKTRVLATQYLDALGDQRKTFKKFKKESLQQMTDI